MSHDTCQRRPETQEIVAALPYESGLAVVLAAVRAPTTTTIPSHLWH